MQLLEQLKTYLEKNNINVQNFSFDTGIPSGRVYKWLKKPDLNVRLDKKDEATITEYLQFGKVSNKLNEPEVVYNVGSSMTMPSNCMETLAKAMEVILSQQKTIESLIGTQIRANTASG